MRVHEFQFAGNENVENVANEQPEQVPIVEAAVEADPQNLAGLAAAHQALLQREGPLGFQPYTKPKMFPLLICGLIVLMLASWLLASLLFMLIPVWIGRQIFALWFDENPRVYELYTAAMGLYTCMLIIRGATLVIGWVQQGWAQLSQKLREWAVIVSKRNVQIVSLSF